MNVYKNQHIAILSQNIQNAFVVLIISYHLQQSWEISIPSAMYNSLSVEGKQCVATYFQDSVLELKIWAQKCLLVINFHVDVGGKYQYEGVGG